jgi:hypothetical protein
MMGIDVAPLGPGSLLLKLIFVAIVPRSEEPSTPALWYTHGMAMRPRTRIFQRSS